MHTRENSRTQNRERGIHTDTGRQVRRVAFLRRRGQEHRGMPSDKQVSDRLSEKHTAVVETTDYRTDSHTQAEVISEYREYQRVKSVRYGRN